MATNLWSQFKELLPSDALQIGTVREIDGDRSRIELPDGAFVWVAGSGVEVGKNAYFQSGEIKEEAPDIIISEVTVY